MSKALRCADPKEKYFEKKVKKWERDDSTGCLASIWRNTGTCWGKVTANSGALSDFETVDLIDDMVDHWEGAHKAERTSILQQFIELQLRHRVRVTFVSGDVHVGAVSRVNIPKAAKIEGSEDRMIEGKEAFRIYNLTSSPVGNFPASVLKPLSKLFSEIDPIPLAKEVFGSHTADATGNYLYFNFILFG